MKIMRKMLWRLATAFVWLWVLSRLIPSFTSHLTWQSLGSITLAEVALVVGIPIVLTSFAGAGLNQGCLRLLWFPLYLVIAPLWLPTLGLWYCIRASGWIVERSANWRATLLSYSLTCVVLPILIGFSTGYSHWIALILAICFT